MIALALRVAGVLALVVAAALVFLPAGLAVAGVALLLAGNEVDR